MKGTSLWTNRKENLSPHLTPAGAWAMALGTSIGWGSLVITSNICLAQAKTLFPVRI